MTRSGVARWWPAPALAGAILLTVAAAIHPEPFPGEVAAVRQLQRLPEPVPGLAEFTRRTTGTAAILLTGVPLGVWLTWRHRSVGIVVVAMALITVYAAQPGIKELVDRPRPTAAHVEIQASWTSEGFPSGHSLGTTMVWGFAAALAWTAQRRRLAALLATPIVFTAISSNIQGVHWPSDALGGTLIGALAAWVMFQVLASSPSHRAGT